MLPPAERLKRNHLFTKAYNAKKSISTPYFTLFFLPRINKAASIGSADAGKSEKKNKRPLVGFVVSKKISKSACARNKMKRRIREAYRQYKAQTLSQWYVIVFVIKEKALNAYWPDLCRTIDKAFDEAANRYGCKV